MTDIFERGLRFGPTRAAYGASSNLTFPLLGWKNRAPAGFITSGPLVDAWRASLNSLSNPAFKVAPTGVWDAALDTATRAFQSSMGLTVDGIVGDNTRSMMAAVGPGDSGTIDPIVMDEAEVSSSPKEAVVAVAQAEGEAVLAAGGSQEEAQAAAARKATELVIAQGGTPADAAQASSAAAATVGPFLDKPLWSGGPSRAKALGVAGIVTGLVVGGFALKGALSPAPAQGFAARGRGNCGCH